MCLAAGGYLSPEGGCVGLYGAAQHRFAMCVIWVSLSKPGSNDTKKMFPFLKKKCKL
jgi:hypothetical protein